MRGKRYFLKGVNLLFKPLEQWLAAPYVDPEKVSAPIFVVGSPRSGSTFLSQLILNRFKLSYISNFSRELYACPIVAGKLGRFLYGFPVKPFPYDSNYGAMIGQLAPHEGGNFWFQWFPRKGEIYTKETEIESTIVEQIRKEISKIEKFYEAPFFSKNLYLSMWIGPLIKIFPNASFIVCRRDIATTALSLLKGRREVHGDENIWLGPSPPGYEQISKKNCHRQVVEQVHYIYQQIDQDIAHYGNQRFLDVPYEAFCKEPSDWLSIIGQFLNSRGIHLDIDQDISAVARKNTSGKKEISKETEDLRLIRREYDALLQEIQEGHSDEH